MNSEIDISSAIDRKRMNTGEFDPGEPKSPSIVPAFCLKDNY